MLHKAQIAPEFEAKALGGETISLNQFRGRKVLLKFHRFSGCPVCRNQLHDLMDHGDDLRRTGLETILLMHSSPEKVRPNFEEQEGIHIIPDPDKRIYRLYGSPFLTSALFSPNSMKHTFKAFGKGYFPQFNRFGGGLTAVPSDFLIDEQGLIAELHYGTDFGDGWTAEEAIEKAKAPSGKA